jgi:hypothetical protein
MPLVNVKLAEGVYTEKQKHDMAARLTDVWSPSKAQRPSARWSEYASKNSTARAGTSAASRIFAWGTSFAVMYIIELAASDARLADGIAQSPLVDGLAAATMARPARSLRLLAVAVRDRLGSLLGRRPATCLAPGDLAVGSTPDALFGGETADICDRWTDSCRLLII